MLRDTPCRCHQILDVDEVPVEFSLAPNGTNVSPNTFDTLFKSHKNSWETMVTS